MLQGIRASPIPMPTFGHSVSYTGMHKMDGYNDVDPWNWPAQQANSSSQNYSHIFDSSLYPSFAPQAAHNPGSVQPRHHSIATSGQSHASTPPPARNQISGSLTKAQPAFRPTWRGFLDTTKDAMTIIEAALQGRLSHISRRPHDKERAEMLTSGTVIVYEENASGIKRWTDAVHWSPSRVMNNCLIYRQLIRALKPEEKKSALNPACGGKRKRKESASPSITNTGENISNVDDEYEHSTFEGTVSGDMTPTSESLGKVYANFAQSLTPDQQRRFCGSLIDSYEFKEGGLMKKTISVKYQGTHHHVISYYSLEDVVNGRLKRPFQDPKLADIQPRADLLTGWKVSLEDEESKDLPLVATYSQSVQPSHFQHAIGEATQGISSQGASTAPLHLRAANEYWQGQTSQYTPARQPAHYVAAQPAAPQYPVHQVTSQYQPHPVQPQQFPTHQSTPDPYEGQPRSSPQSYAAPQSATPHYASPQSATSAYASQQPPVPQYSHQPSSISAYNPQPSSAQHYPGEQHVSPTQQYPSHFTSLPYPTGPHGHVNPSHVAQYGVSHTQAMPAHIAHSQTVVHPATHSPVHGNDPIRRASAPTTMQTYGQPQPHTQYPPNPQPQSYYPVSNNFGF